MPRPFAPHIVEPTMLTPWQDPLAMAAPIPSPGWETVPGGVSCSGAQPHGTPSCGHCPGACVARCNANWRCR
jgi:hypothetical protein